MMTTKTTTQTEIIGARAPNGSYGGFCVYKPQIVHQYYQELMVHAEEIAAVVGTHDHSKALALKGGQEVRDSQNHKGDSRYYETWSACVIIDERGKTQNGPCYRTTEIRPYFKYARDAFIFEFSFVPGTTADNVLAAVHQWFTSRYSSFMASDGTLRSPMRWHSAEARLTVHQCAQFYALAEQFGVTGALTQPDNADPMFKSVLESLLEKHLDDLASQHGVTKRAAEIEAELTR